MMQQIFTYVTYGVLGVLLLVIVFMVLGVTRKDKAARDAEKQEKKAAAKKPVEAPKGFYRNENEDIDLIARPAQKNNRRMPPPPTRQGPVTIPDAVTSDVKRTKPGSFFEELGDDDFKL